MMIAPPIIITASIITGSIVSVFCLFYLLFLISIELSSVLGDFVFLPICLFVCWILFDVVEKQTTKHVILQQQKQKRDLQFTQQQNKTRSTTH